MKAQIVLLPSPRIKYSSLPVLDTSSIVREGGALMSTLYPLTEENNLPKALLPVFNCQQGSDQRAILAPLNADVDTLNTAALERLAGSSSLSQYYRRAGRRVSGEGQEVFFTNLQIRDCGHGSFISMP